MEDKEVIIEGLHKLEENIVQAWSGASKTNLQKTIIAQFPSPEERAKIVQKMKPLVDKIKIFRDSLENGAEINNPQKMRFVCMGLEHYEHDLLNEENIIRSTGKEDSSHIDQRLKKIHELTGQYCKEPLPKDVNKLVEKLTS